MTEDQRKQAEDMLDIWIRHELSGDGDAGWHGAGLFNVAMEQANMIGGSTSKPLTVIATPTRGGGGNSNAKMIKEIRYVRNPHYLLPYINRAMDNLKKNKPKAYLCMITIPFLQVSLNKTISQSHAYKSMGVTPKFFRYNREAGLLLLLHLVELYQEEEAA